MSKPPNMGAQIAWEDESQAGKESFSHQKAKSFHARNPTLLASPSFGGLAGRGALRARLAIPGASDKEELLLDAQLAAAKKLEMALQKSAAARKKEAKKTAQDLVKAAKASAATTRFVWSEAALLELLGYVKMLKDEHDEVMKQPGFTPLSKFFLANIDRKNAFPLLVAIENNTLLRQYRALMNMWRQVKDFTNQSGNAGLFAGLVQYRLLHALWVVLLDMHGDNAGETGVWHEELHGDTETLLGTVPPPETTTEFLEAHDSKDNELPPTIVFDPATRLYGPPTGRKRQRLTEAAQEAMLTLAEQALDESPPPEELQHLVPPTTTATSVPATPQPLSCT
ncbi:hypothetical protein PCASD_17129 [Puccinia coronata f. sp. avenae]|uniref:Uncharacterized protein n=1 Tax=Puccinia coronata f. sp. avenae TaxID=200324 RepID=A0A2N5SXH2_9BASI|nr:hypothetical protein PCASD_17129 [Puccinia coronata f. sp. avenae]